MGRYRNIYLVERTDDIGYDECASHIVSAYDEIEAREYCACECSDEGREIWKDKRTKVKQIIPSIEKGGIILTDFRAG